jgi:hypothetical protein
MGAEEKRPMKFPMVRTDAFRNIVRVQSRIIVKVGPFCRKGHCSLLQAATRATLIKEQHFIVERTFALAVRLAAKVLLGKEDLQKSETAPNSA